MPGDDSRLRREAATDGGTVRIDGDVITGVHGVDAGWPRLLASTAVSVSEGGFDV